MSVDLLETRPLWICHAVDPCLTQGLHKHVSSNDAASVGSTCTCLMSMLWGDTRVSITALRAMQIRTGRGVPISSQLRSHQLFSQNFDCFAGLVDSATLYHTGAVTLSADKPRPDSDVVA